MNEDRVKEIITLTKQHGNGAVAESMMEAGITYKVNYGVTIPELQQIALPYKMDHELAIRLFEEDVRECKIIATMIDNPLEVTGSQIDSWSEKFDNQEIVEQVCSNLFWKSDFALPRSLEWCLDEDILLKKAGLLIAGHRASDSNVNDSTFEPYIKIVEELSETETEFDGTSAIFALREIAKRSELLKEKVIKASEKMVTSSNSIAAWIGNQLLFELTEE